MHRLMGSCEESEGLLSEHMEGELRGFRRLRVETHLRVCSRCRAASASFRRAVTALRALRATPLDPAPATAEAVIARIRGTTGRAGL